jgi:methyl coenzyme M reductase alpha subunit
LNIRALIRKLAVEEFRSEQCEQKVGKTYRIYNTSSILRRRKTAGLEWVIRTKGVTFVDPNTGQPLEERSAMEESRSGTDSVPDMVRLQGQTTGTDSVGDNRY